MNGEVDEKKAFAAIHDLKNDAALLSCYVERLCNETDEKEAAIEAFIKQYNVFLEKYENSVNDKIKAFVDEIKGIVIKHKSELLGLGMDISDNCCRLLFLDSGYTIKDVSTYYDKQAKTVFEVLSEALLNAEIHMERFIPGKYLSYDADKDYRILRQEGNIYTKKV